MRVEFITHKLFERVIKLPLSILEVLLFYFFKSADSINFNLIAIVCAYLTTAISSKSYDSVLTAHTEESLLAAKFFGKATEEEERERGKQTICEDEII